MSIKTITKENFDTEVKNSGKPVLLDFWAPWCGPCRKMADVMAQIAEEYQGKVNVYKLNTDECLKTAKEYSISSLPSILIFKGGEAKERLVGLMPKSSIINNIEKYL